MTDSVFSNKTRFAAFEYHQKNAMFDEDSDPNKVNLTVGAYRTNEGLPWLLPPVRKAEIRLAADPSLNHEYLPVLGFEPFCHAATELILGRDSPAILEGRVTTIQTISCTGAMRTGADYLANYLGKTTIYISHPSWLNHKAVFRSCGFTQLIDYPYYDNERKEIDFIGLIKILEHATERAVVLFHTCAHNPSGMDLTRKQWAIVADVVKRRHLIPFFDTAYLGFVSGDPHLDAWPIRYFVSQGLEMFVAQSFAKTLSLYNERIGSLTIVTKSPEMIEPIRSQMTHLVRTSWSIPPSHGARVAHLVLTDPQLREEWLHCIETMWSRTKAMRGTLRCLLEELGTPGTWDHITNQVGLFSYSGLSEAQVKHLIDVYKIFMLKDGRMNVCGLNTKNVAYVARAIDYAVRNVE